MNTMEIRTNILATSSLQRSATRTARQTIQLARIPLKKIMLPACSALCKAPSNSAWSGGSWLSEPAPTSSNATRIAQRDFRNNRKSRAARAWVAAKFIVGSDGLVKARQANVEFRERMEPETVLTTLQDFAFS